MNTRSITAVTVAAALGVAFWAWHVSSRATQLDVSLDAANKHIEELNGSLVKARRDLNDTREELNRSLDDAEQASQSPPAQEPAPLAPPPIQQAQPQPTSPIELAQLQMSQTQDPSAIQIDPVLELKGRH